MSQSALASGSQERRLARVVNEVVAKRGGLELLPGNDGRDIVAAVVERFRSGGAAAVELGVLVANEAARSFWERLGYRAIDVRPDRDKGRPTAVLEKPL